ncbi:MAG TPA: hypothetical protein VLC92_08700 [Rhodocyclaceae bacterium]|nr:hypothetical protein [Rhodocyclaceae bacterium]
MTASTAYAGSALCRRAGSLRGFLLAWLGTLILTACVAVPISYYDAGTYAHLTDLKAETAVLVESFDSRPVKANEQRIDDVTLSLRKAYEYEHGKGANNSDTTAQFSKVIGLFKEDVITYRENGPGGLGPKYFREAAVVLEQAFDVMIATEAAKNKNTR